MLIGLRIARGLSQQALACALGIDESMVSRDERNGYNGVTVEQALKVSTIDKLTRRGKRASIQANR